MPKSGMGENFQVESRQYCMKELMRTLPQSDKVNGQVGAFLCDASLVLNLARWSFDGRREGR